MKKIIIGLMVAGFATSALAESSSLNLSLPSAPTAYGQDAFRTGDLDCKNAIGGGTNLEFGVTGIIDNAKSPFSSNTDPLYPQRKDIGVYARITIPLDGPKERVNCNTLYQLELQKKRLEVLKLKQELEQLRKLNDGFEN
jgi:hypothetical protein